jgi:hypothetical protein
MMIGATEDYRHHGIGPLVVVRVGKVEDLRPVGHEDAAQEPVHKVHLADHVHKVEAVTQKIPRNNIMIVVVIIENVSS